MKVDGPVKSGAYRGAAWLSSARAVRCWVKSRNERNPYLQLPAVRPGTLERLPTQVERKVGMTSSHHGPYVWGYTRDTMAGPMGKAARLRKSPTPVSVRIGVCNSTP